MQKAVDKVVKLSESDKRQEVISFLNEIENKTSTETILSSLVMRLFEKVEVLEKESNERKL